VAAARHDRVGVLVVRVWFEAPDVGAAVRARVTMRSDLLAPGGHAETIAVAGVDEVGEVVRAWLAAFVEDRPDRL
jgi:hypothetical protein